jgi:hypothetical protein
MPDMERTLRSLELDIAKTPEQKAYARGLHAGMDKARFEIVAVAIFFSVLMVWIGAHI